jgi:sugar porter (SP) family MFS transporter
LGGLLFGFDTAVIAGTTDTLTQVYHLAPAVPVSSGLWDSIMAALGLGITVSSAVWGTVVGAMLAGFPGERFGRRSALKMMGILYIVSALGCALAWSWHSLVLFRFIGGLGIGGSSVLGPMYIAEIAPAESRGRLVGVFQFNIVFGILAAYLSNYLVSLVGLGATEWRWEFGVAAVPAILFLLLLFTIPESPRWLVGQNAKEDAARVLKQTGEQNVEQAMREISESIEAERTQTGERLFSGKHAFPIFLAVSIALFNQLSGINAILYYLNTIFAYAGFNKVSANLQAVAIGFTNLVFTMIAMSVIDKIGRKTLLLVGSVGTALCLGGVSAVFLTGRHQSALVWLLIGFIAFFAFSQGAVIWVYLAEVFPNAVRAKGQSLGSFSHWIMNALISMVFPLMAARSGGYPFVFFSFMMVVQFFVVLFTYPETKGISLEDMQKKLGARAAA